MAATETRSRTAIQLAAGLVAAVATVAAYLAWLGWHAEYYTEPGTTTEQGPYRPWQVIGLALTLGMVAAVGGWRRCAVATALASTCAVTLMFSIDAATKETDDASLWPIGASYLGVGAAVGLGVVAAIARGMRDWRSA